jgi:hypothetical protein
MPGGIPPACPNHLDPTGIDTPAATAASSLLIPAAIANQNLAPLKASPHGRSSRRRQWRPPRPIRPSLSNTHRNLIVQSVATTD